MSLAARLAYGWKAIGLVAAILSPLAVSAFVVGADSTQLARKSEVSALDGRVSLNEQQIKAVLDQQRELREEMRAANSKMIDILVGIADHVGAPLPRHR